MHLSKFESLYENTRSDKAKTAFLKNYIPDIQRLSVFSEIHDQFADESQVSDNEELSNEYQKIILKQQSSGYSSGPSSLETSKDSVLDDSSSQGSDIENLPSSYELKTYFSKLMHEMDDNESFEMAIAAKKCH